MNLILRSPVFLFHKLGYWFPTLRLALYALRRNVLRSALTTLGIVIGVAAVIAMVEIGQGSATAVKKTIASMGANNLLIQPGAASSSTAARSRSSAASHCDEIASSQ